MRHRRGQPGNGISKLGRTIPTLVSLRGELTTVQAQRRDGDWLVAVVHPRAEEVYTRERARELAKHLLVAADEGDQLTREDATGRCEHCRAHLGWQQRSSSWDGIPIVAHACPSILRGWWWCTCCKAWRYANPSTSASPENPVAPQCWRCGTGLIMGPRHPPQRASGQRIWRFGDGAPLAPPPARPQPNTSMFVWHAPPPGLTQPSAFLTQSKTETAPEQKPGVPVCATCGLAWGIDGHPGPCRNCGCGRIDDATRLKLLEDALRDRDWMRVMDVVDDMGGNWRAGQHRAGVHVVGGLVAPELISPATTPADRERFRREFEQIYGERDETHLHTPDQIRRLSGLPRAELGGAGWIHLTTARPAPWWRRLANRLTRQETR